MLLNTDTLWVWSVGLRVLVFEWDMKRNRGLTTLVLAQRSTYPVHTL